MVCGEQELTFTMVVAAGSHSFRPADGVALSRSGISRRKYIGEITAINGIILTVNIVWPASADDSSRKDIVGGEWCLHKFPSLVGYRRIAAALKAFQDTTSCGQALYEGIVGSFFISEGLNSEPRCKRDAGTESAQIGNYQTILSYIPIVSNNNPQLNISEAYRLVLVTSLNFLNCILLGHMSFPLTCS